MEQKKLTCFFSRDTSGVCDSNIPSSSKLLFEENSTSDVPMPISESNSAIVNNIESDAPQNDKEDGSQCEWPNVWSEDMWRRKLQAFPWLDCQNGKLGCKVCREVTKLGAFKKERISVSNEWRSYTVTFNGSNRSAQLKSLRKKIILHKQSNAHNIAQNILNTSKKKTIN